MPVRCLLLMDSINFFTAVGYFLPVNIIHTLVIFLAVTSCFRGIWFVGCNTEDMLLCSHYWSTIANWSTSWWGDKCCLRYIIFDKGLVLDIYFSVVRAEIFFPLINTDPGDHTFRNVLLCSSNLADGQYLRFLVVFMMFL